MKKSKANRSYILSSFFIAIYLLFFSNVMAETRNLFSEASGSNLSAADLQYDSTATRQQIISVNTGLFDAFDAPDNKAADLSNTLVLDLFGTKVTATLDRIEHVSKDSISWIGHIGDDMLDSVILVRSGNILQGNIVYKRKHYQIRFVTNNAADTNGATHVLKEVDFSKMPPEHPTGKLPDGSDGKTADGNNQSSAGDTRADTSPDTSADSGAIIDSMVVYTNSARVAAGGTAAMNALVDLAITETNDSYANSGITPRLHLVYKGQVSYSESSFSTDLSRLKGTSDGFMDNVHTLRNTHKADVVSLFINNSSSCGLGYVNATATSAFSVVHWNCATGYYSFGHEIGHNQGALHDWDVSFTNSCAHGYVNKTGAGWRTVMAYATGCPGGNCTRLKYWSNPSKTYGGAPMGKACGTYHQADNHSKLNSTAYTVANFRQGGITTIGTPTLYSPSGTTTDTTPTFTWSKVSGATWYRLWVRDSAGAVRHNSWHTSSATNCTSGSTCSYTPTAVLPAGSSTFWVQAYGSGIYGSWSSGKSFTVNPSTGIGTATLYSPSGTTTDTTPTFTWSKVSGATWYRLWVRDSAGAVRHNSWHTSSATNCTSGSTCSYTPTAVLPAGSSTFWVQAYGSGIYGSWSSGKSFTIVAGGGCNFTQNFSSTPSDWTQNSGTWSTSGGYYFTPGRAGKSNTSTRNATCGNVDVTARVWKSGTASNATRVIIRASGSVQSNGRHSNYYSFQITDSGKFSVWKSVNNTASAVKYWTTTNTIHTGNAWNLIRAVASGSSLKFYINGTLVWTGSDSSLSTGKVGVGFYSSNGGTSTSGDRLWVDYVTAQAADAGANALGDIIDTSDQQTDESLSEDNL